MSMRVVSMLPSATEIVCALGAGASLVGVSHECDHPAEIRGLPAVTRARLDPRGTSITIDDEVRTLIAAGLGIYEIDLELLRALRPDVIVTQHQCDVCAVPYAEVEAAARSVFGAGVTIVSLAPRRLADVWDDIDRVASALDRRSAGVTLRAGIDERFGRLATMTASLPRPAVACIEWLEPLMTAGNWMPELVASAGGRYPFTAPGEASGVTTWEAVAEHQPEVVVVMPCGFPIAQTRRELDRVRARPEWQALAAVRAGRASVVDGNAYFNRPGPRLVESAEILAALVHPAICGPFAIRDAVEPIR
jgi:iron complex transport system substrate-binding protein